MFNELIIENEKYKNLERKNNDTIKYQRREIDRLRKENQNLNKISDKKEEDLKKK